MTTGFEHSYCPSYCDVYGKYVPRVSCCSLAPAPDNITMFCCRSSSGEMFCCSDSDIALERLPNDVTFCSYSVSMWTILPFVIGILFIYTVWKHWSKQKSTVAASMPPSVGPRTLRPSPNSYTERRREEAEDEEEEEEEVQVPTWTFSAIYLLESSTDPPAGSVGPPAEPQAPPAYDDVSAPPPSYSDVWGHANATFDLQESLALPSSADPSDDAAPPPYSAIQPLDDQMNYTGHTCGETSEGTERNSSVST